MSTEEARRTIDARDHLRAIRNGTELAHHAVPKMSTGFATDTPLLIQASDAPFCGDTATRSRRWVVDRGSFVDIVGEGSVTKNETRVSKDRVLLCASTPRMGRLPHRSD